MTALTAPRTRHGRPGTGPGPRRPGPGHPPTRRRPAPSELPPDAQLAAAERLTTALGRWYLDAQAGRVEVRQLRALLTPTAEQRVMAAVLRARARHRRRRGHRPTTGIRVRRVVVHRASEHFEALAIVDDGVRTVAVVAVLHPTEDGWVVSELARPDDGLPALRPPVLREDPACYQP